MSEHTKIHDRFEYHLEDLDCACCIYYKRRTKHNKSCSLEACEFEDIRNEAIANNRIKRKRGWFKWQRL